MSSIFPDLLEQDKKIEKFERVFKGMSYGQEALRTEKEILVTCNEDHHQTGTLEYHLSMNGCIVCNANKARASRELRETTGILRVLERNFDVTLTELLLQESKTSPLVITCKHGHKTMTTLSDIADECIIDSGEILDLECETCKDLADHNATVQMTKRKILSLNYSQTCEWEDEYLTQDSLVKVVCKGGHRDELTVKELLALKDCPYCEAIEEQSKADYRQDVYNTFKPLDQFSVTALCDNGHVLVNDHCGLCSNDTHVDNKTLLPYLESVTGYIFDTLGEVTGVTEPIKASCKRHGPFETTPMELVEGVRCPYCEHEECLDTVYLAKSITGAYVLGIKMELTGFNEELVSFDDHEVIYNMTFKEPGYARYLFDQLFKALIPLSINVPDKGDVTYVFHGLTKDINGATVNHFNKETVDAIESLCHSLSAVSDFSFNTPMFLDNPWI